MHTRVFLGILDTIYQKVCHMSENAAKWDPEAHDEMLGALFMPAFSEANIRWDVSRRVSATDATVSKMGSCTALHFV